MPNDEDTLAHPEQPRFLLSAWLWAVILFVFFGAIVAITFGTMPRGSTYEVERAKNRTEKLKTAREEWTKNSEGYAWVDKAKGVARIPIARAMELETAELKTKKPEPAGPIATPAPAETPANAAGAAQPGASAIPATGPNSRSEIPPVSPTAGPVQHSVGTPLPARGATGNPPPASPKPTSSPR